MELNTVNGCADTDVSAVGWKYPFGVDGDRSAHADAVEEPLECIARPVKNECNVVCLPRYYGRADVEICKTSCALVVFRSIAGEAVVDIDREAVNACAFFVQNLSASDRIGVKYKLYRTKRGCACVDLTLP